MVRYNQNYQIIRVRNSNLPTVKYGNGIFQDTARILGRKLLKSGKYFAKQAYPFVIKLGKELLDSGKNLFHQAKPEVEKIIADKTKDVINKLVNNPKTVNIKETFRDTSSQIRQNVINPTIDKSKEEVNRIISKIINGQGVGIIKNNKFK